MFTSASPFRSSHVFSPERSPSRSICHVTFHISTNGAFIASRRSGGMGFGAFGSTSASSPPSDSAYKSPMSNLPTR